MKKELALHPRRYMSTLAMARYRTGIGLGITLTSIFELYKVANGDGPDNLVRGILPIIGTIFGGVGTRIAYKEMRRIEDSIIRSRQ